MIPAMQWALGIFRKREDDLLFLMAGPVSLFCTAVVGMQRGGNADLFLVSLLGLALCVRGKFRGLVYSLAALFILSCIRHAFFVDAHLWNLGIEGSIALGFAMTFTAFDEIEKGQTTLKEIAKNKDQIIRNLEEDLAKERQEKVGEMALQNSRLMDLQKEFGEKESELSSIQILSDVLRKTTAEATEARDRASVEEAEKEKLLIAKTAELDELKQNFAHAQEIGAVAMRDLKTSLEEKHRLSAEIRSLEEKLAKSNEQIAAVEKSVASTEAIRAQAEAARLDAERQREHLLAQLKEKSEAADILQKRLQTLQPLYLELKKQFQEKSEALHESRQEFFRADTALQAMHIDRERMTEEPTVLEKTLTQDLDNVESERAALENENAQLTELVSIISLESPVQIIERLTALQAEFDEARKKGVKKKKRVTAAK